MRKPKGSGVRDIGLELGRRPLMFIGLLLDQLMIVVDRIGDPGKGGGKNGNPSIVITDMNGFYNFEIGSRTFLGQNPGELNEFGKGRRTAVHRRNLFRIDIDEGIIDSQTPEGGKHVFGRLNLESIGSNHGAKFRRS